MNGISKARRGGIPVTPNEPKPTIMKTLLKRTGLAGLTAACLAAPVLRAEITSWAPLAPGTPLNASPERIMQAPRLITLTSGATEKLYAAWAEQGGANTYTSQIRVAVYQDKILGVAPHWKQIATSVNGTPRGPTLGINYDPLASAGALQLVVHNGSLHATWHESVPAKGGRTISRIRVSRYNGVDDNPDWTFIDGNAIGGLNLNASQNAIQPVAASYGDQLVVTWAETAAISRKASAQQVRARAYNGSQWT